MRESEKEVNVNVVNEWLMVLKVHNLQFDRGFPATAETAS